MPINFHPKQGTILLCNFGECFKEPEMVKRRPVVVVSPPISQRPKLCTVVALSSDPPRVPLAYHALLSITLPPPWDEGPNWVKGDMVYAAGFHRLDLLRMGKDESGQRQYYITQLSADDLKTVRKCVLNALGLATLTKHLP